MTPSSPGSPPTQQRPHQNAPPGPGWPSLQARQARALPVSVTVTALAARRAPPPPALPHGLGASASTGPRMGSGQGWPGSLQCRVVTRHVSRMDKWPTPSPTPTCRF